MGVLALATGAADPTAAPPPTELAVGALANEVRTKGWIAFSAKTEVGDWDLFICRPDGTDRRPLTTTRDFHEAGVRFSPDGERMLYYRMPKSESLDNNTYGSFELMNAGLVSGFPTVCLLARDCSRTGRFRGALDCQGRWH